MQMERKSGIDMYEPKQTQIDDKVKEMLAAYMLKTDWLCDALVSCLDEFRAFYNNNDNGFEFKEAVDKHIIHHAQLETKARDALIAERGHTVRTDVDDYKFIPHDTRY